MPVTVRVECVGSLALKALTTQELAVTGQVVNTFPNSFYARTGKDELVFFTNRPLRSPVTVNLDTTSDLERLVRPLEHLSAQGKELRIGTDIIVELSTAHVYQDRIEPVGRLSSEFNRVGESLRIASFMLGIMDTSQSVLDPHALSRSRIVEFVANGIIPLRYSETEGRFRDAALKIVGLGSGFTPSGDDMLGGFIAGYNYCSRAIERAAILFDSGLLEERTSWISATLLDYMQRLILDEQLHNLVKSVKGGDQYALVDALETIFPRGHTSGIDIAVGTILALSLVRDVALRKKETEVIVRVLGLNDLA